MDNTFRNKKTVWITWHSVPRSQNIAKYLNIPIFEYFVNDNIFKRHIYSSIWTVKFLCRQKPDIVFLHYSYLLLFFIVLYKKFCKKNIVVIADCHNKALRRKLKGIASKIYEIIKRFSFKNSDLAIVTNEGMIKDITQYNEEYFILPDKIPEFELCLDTNNKENYCVYISTFAIDEPVNEILEVANIMENNVKIYWTGKKSNKIKSIKKIPKNIIFTGYIDYQEYYKLLANANAILVLTYEDNCLQCGAYEGLNAEVPLVISDNNAARDYFGDSAIYTKIDPKLIAESLLIAFKNSDSIKQNSIKIKKQRNDEYRLLSNNLVNRIELILGK